MQVARHAAQRLFLDVNQLPGKFLQCLGLRLELLRQVLEPGKGLAVGFERVEARPEGQQEQNADHNHDVPFDRSIDRADSLRRFGLGLIVQHQQARRDLRNHRALAFEFGLDKRARFCLVVALGQSEDRVRRTPEVLEGAP